MNNQGLDHLLRSAPIPERSAEYWNEFPGQVTRALSRPEPGPGLESVRPQRARFAWGVAATALVLLATLVSVLRQVAPGPALVTEDSAARYRTCLREFRKLFPAQIRAVIQENGDLRLVLSDKADVPDSPALLIRFTDGVHRHTVITFSGQRIELGVGHFDVLTDASDHILLVGDHGVWSSVNPSRKLGAMGVEGRVMERTL